jgi:hypothetical protein
LPPKQNFAHLRVGKKLNQTVTIQFRDGLGVSSRLRPSDSGQPQAFQDSLAAGDLSRTNEGVEQTPAATGQHKDPISIPKSDRPEQACVPAND